MVGQTRGGELMECVVFEIKCNAVGRFYFVLKDAAGQVLAVSASFGGRAALEKCIANVRETAPVARTIEQVGSMEPPVFEMQNGPDGFVFLLRDYGGEVIFSSTAFETRNDCVIAIDTLKHAVCNAGVLDLA